MIFLVIGQTGSGKTNFINSLAGTPGNAKAAFLHADTRNITSHTIERDARRLVFIDTPGLNSTYLPDEGIFALVAKWLETNYRPGGELGIIYLHRITDDRMQRSPHQHIEMFRKHCKGVTVHHVCLVTTMWDDVVHTSEAEMKEKTLEEELQKTRVRNIFRRFDNQRPSFSAWDIVNELIGLGEEARQLLAELEDRERHPNEPGIGRESYTRSQSLLLQRREELMQLIDQTETDGNTRPTEELRAELDTLDAQIRRTFEEAQLRKTSLLTRVLQWLARKFGTTYGD